MKKNISENIQLVLIFKEEQTDILNMFLCTQQIIANWFGIDYHYLEYQIKTGAKEKFKRLKYNSKNIEKFISEIPAMGDGGFSLIRYMPNFIYAEKDIEFIMSYDPFMRKFSNNSSVILSIDRELWLKSLKESQIKEKYLEVAKTIGSMNKRLVYGYIYAMDKNKFPFFYALGTGTNTLTQYEDKELKKWGLENGSRQCERKAWRIFWGNLLTNEHLVDGIFKDQVKAVVGGEHFIEIDTSTFFFVLPDSDLVLGEENKHFVDKLHKLVKMQ